MKNITIAIDAMGGDHGLDIVIPACIRAIKNNPDLKLLLVGVQDKISASLKKYGMLSCQQFTIIHASEVVTMDELPSHALRNKKDSSMRIAINLVKEGRAQACVSAGNTGALMATARYVLKTLPGIDRPAIVSELPTMGGKTRVIDLGANVDSCAEHLFQFAVMGSALIQAIENKPKPKIGLLNIGVEEIKGNDQVKRTAHMLAECSVMNYVGYVEGDYFYSGDVDLVVCDGFVGNVALKASEGLAKLLLTVLKESFNRNWLTKIAGFIALPALKHLKNRLDPSRYNGASLLGLNGIVVKSHGGANEVGFQHAIEQAVLEVKNNVVDLVRDQINDFINQGLLL
ncbi:phosphate acyltransferase PlsX [Legionella pneumophila]|uniref:Phosphate acyltransferase n=1 Tax=Legionella pneumophila subsp. pascullei TaxID=91890 RepID=A0AAX2IUK0_LEGPN|nr:phosphate acyltransferase PlsX [Legionella pneumophila]AMP89959.1 phosphate acyltransferase [Legionella pneumophila subsp. pascullei]AMP92374.1 phosphate acyltransferase [Legionella pneumophila subsp. pascullei]AMP95340.1 phosphate acyltransferase [Legionella pneumophila subsp. pascullei]SQG90236.1 fatty acid/phospholipid synthesis protein [Legionella pneumophila subsp. pascullei]VEH06308.1 fatty acid/phospholipid synthesis protein [Legionella pneumophila subsp. pascullei]